MWLTPQREIDEALAALPSSGKARPPGFFEGLFSGGVGDVMAPASSEAFAVGTSYSGTRLYRNHYDALIEELNRDRPSGQQLGNPYDPLWLFGSPVRRPEREEEIWSELDKARTADPGRFANLPRNYAEFQDRIAEEARGAMDEAEKARGQTGALAGGIGTMIGAAPALIADPVNLMAMVVGGTAAQSLLRFALTEALAGGVATAASLPAVAAFRSEIGREMSATEMAAQVATGAVAGAAFATAGRAAGRYILAPAWRAGVAAVRGMGDEASPNLRAAANIVEDEIERAEQNPYADTPQGRDAYRRDLAQAEAAFDEGRLDMLPEGAVITINGVTRVAGRPPSAAFGGTSPAAQGRNQVNLSDYPEGRRPSEPVSPEWAQFAPGAEAPRGSAVQGFRPAELETDAAMMQYKRGADEEGVTERLYGVKEWNPAFAGQVLVYETRDGRRIVADGHQRLALAQRLARGGQDVTLYGLALRESEGWTPEKARLLAAKKNIAEGSGDALDAAAILRLAPEALNDLPPRSALVRQARPLAALSEDAWGMVRNGVASEGDAGLVGRLVNDPNLHAAILDYVGKAGAETAEEAELIVRQAVAAGARTEVQTDMFGAMLKADLILPERVRILKSALTQLRKDKGLFKTLTGRQDAIAAEGNVLAPDANAAALLRVAQLFENIKALAERKGPISDALQAAAVRSKETGKRSAAVGEFVADVRGRMERNELAGDATGRAIGDVGPQDEGLDVPAQPGGARPQHGGGLAATEFADPVGKPEAFARQRADLAASLGGEAMHPGFALRATPGEPAKPSPFGDEAAKELSLFDALDPDARVPVPEGMGREDGMLSNSELRSVLEREAKAVERLRRCAEGEE